jgi:hypothetical protein
MPIYLKDNKLLTSNMPSLIDKTIIANHINSSTASRLSGKNPSTDRLVYSSQNPYGGPNDSGIWVRNPNCWINGVTNISCFSPAQRGGANWWQRGGTLITRKHVLFAKHFKTSILSGGTPLIFVDENNNAIRRNIIQYGDDTTDISIALLDSEVPSNIKIAKVLPKNYKDFISSKLPDSAVEDFGLFGLVGVALDQEEKAHVKTSTTIYFNIIAFDNFGGVNPYPAWTENIVVGDSGNPVFYIIDNELVVLTTWLTPGSGPFITKRYDQVNAIIEELSPGEGYSLTPIDLQTVYDKYYPRSFRCIRKQSTSKDIIPQHINSSTANRLVGKNPATDRLVYSSQNPYGGVDDAGIWVRNPNCWINGVTNISCFSPAQRSGAAWNTRGGTLITRKHVLFAKHFVTSILPNGGTPIIFVDENNNAIKRNIIQYADDWTDISIALLDSEVPSNIKIAKVLPIDFTNYINATSINGSIMASPPLYGVVLNQLEEAILKRWKGGTQFGTQNYGPYQLSGAYNLIEGASNSSNTIQDVNYLWDKPIVVGDSGNPFFLIIDNELVVTHALLTTPAEGPFITDRYSVVNSIIESLSPGENYSLTPIDLQAVRDKYDI